MYYLNTTRQLRSPLSVQAVEQFVAMLTNEIAPGVAATEGLQSISWMLSSDRLTLQAFSGWLAPDGPALAEQHPLHKSNSIKINDMLGGLAVPQQHAYYQLLVERSVG